MKKEEEEEEEVKQAKREQINRLGSRELKICDLKQVKTRASQDENPHSEEPERPLQSS